MMPFISWYTCCIRTQWPPGRMYSYFEMQGCHALYEKEVCHFHEFHAPGVLVGLSFAVK